MQYSEDKQLRRFIKKVIALALIPVNKVETVLIELIEECESKFEDKYPKL